MLHRIFRVINLRRLIWIGHVACVAEMTSSISNFGWNTSKEGTRWEI